MTDPSRLRRAYSTTDPLQTRIDIHARYGIHPGDAFQELTAWAQRRVAPGKILDVGMGTGHWYRAIQSQLSESSYDYEGVDSSPAMAAAMAGQVAGAPNARVRIADAQCLPFADASFHWVGLHFMLYHVPHPDRALQEAWRVLKPGGIVMTLAHGPENLSALMSLHSEALAQCLRRTVPDTPSMWAYTLDNGGIYFPGDAVVNTVEFPSGLRFPTVDPALDYYLSGFIERHLSASEIPSKSVRSCLEKHVRARVKDIVSAHGYFEIPGRTGWLWAVKPEFQAHP